MSHRSRATLLAALLVLLAAAPARAAGCPGAESCPYLAAATVGERSGGVLRFPQATAVGPDGAVYVADQYTHAIQIFGPDGGFRGEVGAAARGGSGLTSVGAVAVAADGSIYAADGTDRIFRFAADGRLLDSWGGTGSDVGRFRFGAGGGNASGAGGGLAVANGTVYVADTRNDRIQRFAADGSRPVVIVGPGRLSRPQGIAVRGSRLIVADDVHHRLAVFDTGGRFIGTVGSGPGPQPRQLRNPYDVAVDGRGRLYVADNSNHRVVRYGPAPGYRYQARWGSFGSGAGQLQYPRGLAVDAGGTSYVADPGNNRVDVFDIGGTPLRSVGVSGRNTGQFIAPLGVGADAGGTRAVADSVVGRVQLLNPDGSVAAAFGSPAPGPTILPDPVAVAFDGGGTAYVLDQRRSRVVVFDRAGTVVRTIGSRGSGPGKLLSPSALAFDAGQVLYVADTGNGRIARFARAARISARSAASARSAVSPSRPTAAASTPQTARPTASTSWTRAATTSPRSLAADEGRPAALARRAGARRRRQRLGRRHRQQPRAAVRAGRHAADELRRARDRARPVREPRGPVRRLPRARHGRRHRQQPRPAVPGGAGRHVRALPPVQNPPAPLLPTQPLPAPPELKVSPARTHGILAARALPLNVRCDLPCTVSVTGTLATRSRKRGARVTLRLRAGSLAAGRSTVIRPVFSARTRAGCAARCTAAAGSSPRCA
jgi:sugar lactone lactonase YvrE